MRKFYLNARMDEAADLQSAVIELDREWQRCLDEGSLLEMDLQVGEMIKESPEIIHEDHRDSILESCNYLAKDIRARKSLGRGKLPSIREVEDLIRFYSTKENLARKRERRIFGHIVTRLQQIHRILSEA